MGYTAEHLAAALRNKEIVVGATARTIAGVNRIRNLEYQGFIFDGQKEAINIDDNVLNASHILISIPPDDNGDPTLRYHEKTIANSKVQWIGYLSTIGVYGDHSGGWVDEDTPVQPISERSRRRVLAENFWLEFGNKNNKRVEIFRLAGIYGPQRNFLDDLRNGNARTILKKGQVFNRIHVDDIAKTLICSLTYPKKSSVYNVTDDQPASSQEVHEFAAKILGIPSPPEIPFEKAQLSEMARSFYLENKRVRNDRIKRELGVKLMFPTYKEGLTYLAKK